MNNSEKKKIKQAIAKLASDDEDGFHNGIRILCHLIGIEFLPDRLCNNSGYQALPPNKD